MNEWTADRNRFHECDTRCRFGLINKSSLERFRIESWARETTVMVINSFWYCHLIWEVKSFEIRAANWGISRRFVKFFLNVHNLTSLTDSVQQSTSPPKIINPPIELSRSVLTEWEIIKLSFFFRSMSIVKLNWLEIDTKLALCSRLSTDEKFGGKNCAHHKRFLGPARRESFGLNLMAN